MSNLGQMRVDSCKNLPVDHPLQPAYFKPLQVVMLDEKVESESPKVASDNPDSTSSHQPTHPDSPQVLSRLEQHLGGELPVTPEKASEMIPEKVTSESPQQQTPNLQKPINICTDLIVHDDFLPSTSHQYILEPYFPNQ